MNDNAHTNVAPRKGISPRGFADRPVSMSFTLRNASGTILASWHGDTRYYAASTMKLAVAMAVLQRIDHGAWPLDLALPATHQWHSGAGGMFGMDDEDVDPLFPAAGESITIRELVNTMIERSCNESTNMLMELVGIDAIHNICRQCGMRDLHVDRLIGDVAAARATGISNQVTTDDLSSLMVQAVRGDWLTTQSTDFLRAALRRQQFPVIAPILPELPGNENAADIDWGSKSGWVDGIRHDVAFIGDPDGEDWHVLAICSSGYRDDEAITAVQAVAAAALQPIVCR